MTISTSDAPAEQGDSISTIEASGATDDVRYILHSENGHTQQPTVPAPERQADVPVPATSAGLADEVIDNADDALPDETQSTISGGQVATESKRGDY